MHVATDRWLHHTSLVQRFGQCTRLFGIGVLLEAADPLSLWHCTLDLPLHTQQSNVYHSFSSTVPFNRLFSKW